MSTRTIVQESPDQAQAEVGPRDAFLSLFEENRRGTIANFFLSAVRSGGARTPQAVVKHVLDNLYRRLDDAQRWPGTWNRGEEQRLLPYVDAIQGNPALALGYAGWALAWCALPDKERERIKRKRHEAYRQQWMGEKPPSEKQLHFLAALGWRGDPPVTSMLEASNLISELKTQRDGGQRG